MFDAKEILEIRCWCSVPGRQLLDRNGVLLVAESTGGKLLARRIDRRPG